MSWGILALTLIKDSLGFAARHWRMLLLLIMPVQLVLVGIAEVSGLQAMTDYTVEQIQASQEEAARNEENESSTSEDLASVDEKPQLKSPESEFTVGASQIVLWVLYGILSVLPIALVMAYVREVFAGREPSVSQLFSIGIPLTIAIVGIYCIVWGSFAVVGGASYAFFASLGLAESSFVGLITIIFAGVLIYLHYRLSLAPFFWLEEKMPLKTALRQSWDKAHEFVSVLIFGNCVLYLGVSVIMSVILSILQSAVPTGGQIFIASLVGGVVTCLQTLYHYRVFAHIKGE